MSIITFPQFQNKFNSALENSINKKYLIAKEITEVFNFANTIPDIRTLRKLKTPYFNKNSTQIFELKISALSRKLFSEVFNKYMIDGDYPLEEKSSENENVYNKEILVINQAKEFSKYYNWLNELQSSPQKSEKKDPLSHKQIMLALHYLGFDMKQFNQVKTGLVLGEVLGLDPKNTTDYIRHVSIGKNNVRTSENLKKVKQLFEKHGLYEIADKINPEKPKE